jgi:hypothetical protein
VADVSGSKGIATTAEINSDRKSFWKKQKLTLRLI